METRAYQRRRDVSRRVDALYVHSARAPASEIVARKRRAFARLRGQRARFPIYLESGAPTDVHFSRSFMPRAYAAGDYH